MWKRQLQSNNKRLLFHQWFTTLIPPLRRFVLPLVEIENVTCLKLMAQTAIPYSYSICLLFCPTFIFPWPHDKSCLIWNVLTDIQPSVFWIQSRLACLCIPVLYLLWWQINITSHPWEVGYISTVRPKGGMYHKYCRLVVSD